jgi:thiol reductant ABC exporter CydC subunit
MDGIPLDVWRSQVAYVPQNPYLFNDTVAANIRLARPEADMQAVVHAAELAYAHEFIQALPQGYETTIGERGARLSAGQAQRIALARAFLQDAWLVVLDEPSANLDPDTEAMLQESLARLLEGRSALIIAHRLNTVTRADRVIILEQGRVVQQGEPATLAKEDGLFQRMLRASSVRFDPELDSIATLRTEENISMRSREETNLQGSTALLPAFSPQPGPAPAAFSVNVFWRLIRLAAPFKGLIALSTLAGAATILSGVGLMAASAYIISAAALRPSIAELQVAIVGVRFFGISRGIFRYLERYLSHQASLQLLARLRIWFYQSLEPLAPARLMSQRSGDLLARILGDIASLQNFYVRALAPPLTALVVGLIVCIFLSRFDPVLGLALAVVLFIAGIGVPWLVRVIGKPIGSQLVIRKAALNVTIVDTIQGLADLLACGRQDSQMKRIDDLSRSLARSQSSMAALLGLQEGLTSLLANMGMWIVLWLAIPLVSAGHIPGVYLAVLALVALSAFEAAIPLPLAAQYLENNLQAAERLFEIVDAKPAVRDPVEPAHTPEDFSLRVEQLRFRYPLEPPGEFMEEAASRSGEQDRLWVIDGLSFELPVGGKLAIVGPSGAGKSTLVRLLLRFWDYQEGAIFLDGSELRGFAQEDVRQRLGVVSQNAYLFSASIRDNLRLARPKATQAEIENAARLAQLDAFIRTLPEGYETWIGEHGLRLSGGERQRLAIARALLREAPLLILDEPTANLDALTERRVFEAVYEMMQGRTTLLITHRLVRMEAMDEIIVLDRGVAVERGRHADLLELGGLYRRMWDLQRGV